MVARLKKGFVFPRIPGVGLIASKMLKIAKVNPMDMRVRSIIE
jgi:hypothetical protein